MSLRWVGGFFAGRTLICPVRAPVFENSAACVYVETSTVCFGMPARNMTNSYRVLRDTAFEQDSSCLKEEIALRGETLFTESLILAQDERWRRA